MKRYLVCALLSISLLANLLTPTVRADDGESASLMQEQQGKIQSFLVEHSIVPTCFDNRQGQDKKNLTWDRAVCIVMQVYNSSEQLGKDASWQKAIKIGLIKRNQAKLASIKPLEFLALVFKNSGISIAPLSKEKYNKLFLHLRLRIRDREAANVLATALEQGLFLEPQTRKDAEDLRKKLSENPLKVTEGLAYLYLISVSKHDEPGITVTQLPLNEPIALESVLKDMIKTIKSESYFASTFDEKKAMQEALKAIVKSLKDDKYIEYYTPEEYKEFSQSLNGDVEGIGAYIEEKDDQILIVSPIDGSPAQKSGLAPGDIVRKVNEESVKGFTLQQAVNKIRGPKGTPVKLTIERNGQMLEFSIIRDKISVPSVISSSRDGVEIIKITQFNSHVADEMQTELKSVAGKHPKGILIDLRNNPGGFLNEVVTIADYFLPKDKAIVILKDHQSESVIKSTLDPIIQNIPVAVLINKGSASASEILSGVLQSYGIAKIYGETSFGKGTVQSVITLRDPDTGESSAFKLTTSEYLVGKPDGTGKSINGIGVKPFDNPKGADTPLLDDKTTTTVDEALETVLQLLR